MLTLNMITDSEYHTAVTPQPQPPSTVCLSSWKHPMLPKWYDRRLSTVLAAAAYTDGYSIYTTIDSKQQIAANDAIDRGLQAYDERHGYRGAERNLGNNPTRWKQVLEQTDTIGNLNRPVISVNEDNAVVLLKDGSSAMLTMEQMKWAKPYINVNKQGEEPMQPSDVVKVGDLVRIRKIDDNVRLSQPRHPGGPGCHEAQRWCHYCYCRRLQLLRQ